MAGSSIGKLFILTTFGESHGKAIGGIIDGCPPGLKLDLTEIQTELDRRKPGQSNISSSRSETDAVQFLSGIVDETTIGTPIGFLIQNSDIKSSDYDHLKDVFRPSHADNTYEEKYGIRDHRGGGRSSARETACRVVAGAILRQFLEANGVSVIAFVSKVGNIQMEDSNSIPSRKEVEAHIVRCPSPDIASNMQVLIEEVKKDGDTVGGVVTCIAHGLPSGLGEPVFDKFHADLGKAMLSINAVKGFEIGRGFESSMMRGSEHNDTYSQEGRVTSNNSGGVQGGITNGNDVVVRLAFKPVATLMKDQTGLTKDGDAVIVEGKGRHDPCVVPRATAIVEAMMLLTIMDHYLRQQAIKG